MFSGASVHTGLVLGLRRMHRLLLIMQYAISLLLARSVQLFRTSHAVAQCITLSLSCSVTLQLKD